MEVGDREDRCSADFADAQACTHAGTTSPLLRVATVRFFVNTDGPGGTRADFEIKYTFGVRPLQQYLIELPGRAACRRSSIAWDSAT